MVEDDVDMDPDPASVPTGDDGSNQERPATRRPERGRVQKPDFQSELMSHLMLGA